MKKLALALATTAAAIIGFAAAAEAAPTKVCFVYVGSHTDGGYSQAHDLSVSRSRRSSAIRSIRLISKMFRKARTLNARSSVSPAPAAR
jgi:basic membrane lipoprotein Med (substrate-binding protein (PBP1-ABC) superfamily)